MDHSPPPTTISRTLPSEPGLDYNALRAEAIRLIQAMSGTIWTDYNESDPGITILEQLCYALTELSYRANLPLTTLLADPDTGKLDPRRQGLSPAPEILPCNPVTAADFRRLLLDRMPEIANIWFTPASITTTSGVNGLYDVTVLPMDQDDCARESKNHRLRHRISRYYNRHRALGEDLNSITILRPLTIHVLACVQVMDSADDVEILATLLFKLALCFTPEPKRRSFNELHARGLSTTEIFTGPLMLRGFIEPEDLTALPQKIEVDALLRMISATNGVLNVTDLAVEQQGAVQAFLPGETIIFAPDTIGRLCTNTCDDTLGIRLFHGKTRCIPPADAVKRRLAQLWATQRQTYKLAESYADYFKLPEEKPIDLSYYSSVQEQFPALYGIGSFGLPAGASLERKAQARQLKGYLMVFDQLMADYFAHLAFLRDLFSPQAGGTKTYGWASLAKIVPDAAALLTASYETGLTKLATRTATTLQRQHGIINLLLSLYASKLAPRALNRCGGDTPNPQTSLSAAQYLLTRMIPATRDRGRAFDYTTQGPAHGQAGLLWRVRAALVALHTSPQTAPQAEPHGVVFGDKLPNITATTLAAHFLPIENTTHPALLHAANSADPLAGHNVDPSLLPALADISRYRLGGLAEHAGLVCLICQDLTGAWWLLNTHADALSALSACAALVRAAHGRANIDEIEIIEWVLLRHALTPADDPTLYNFRVSAVLVDRPHPHAWQTHAEAILREAMPAHLALDCIFLDPPAYHHFRKLHKDWCATLRKNDPPNSAHSAKRLQDYLRTHKPNSIMPNPIEIFEDEDENEKRGDAMASPTPLNIRALPNTPRPSGF